MHQTPKQRFNDLQQTLLPQGDWRCMISMYGGTQKTGLEKQRVQWLDTKESTKYTE